MPGTRTENYRYILLFPQGLVTKVKWLPSASKKLGSETSHCAMSKPPWVMQNDHMERSCKVSQLRTPGPARSQHQPPDMCMSEPSGNPSCAVTSGFQGFPEEATDRVEQRKTSCAEAIPDSCSTECVSIINQWCFYTP